ncbi:MAG: phage tail tape measure protein [Nitrospirota bacterium]
MAQDIVLKIKVDGATGAASIESFEGQIKKLGQTSESTFGKISQSFDTLGGKWAALGGAALFGKSISDFNQYQSALTDMAKVTDDSLDSINKKIMSLGSSLGSPTELMRGYYQVISAGVTDSARAMDVLTTASKMGEASHVEQAQSILALTKVMAGYEGQIKNTSDAADLLYGIERLGQTRVSELVPVIGDVASISHVLNVNQNEMGASLARISQLAGDTSIAADEYKAVLNALIKPTKQMNDLLSEHGYASGGAAIADRGFMGVLKMIQDATDGNTTALGKLIQRREAILGFLAMMSDGGKTVANNLKVLENNTGASERAFQNWEQTGEASEKRLKDSFSRDMIDLGKIFEPVFMEFTKGLDVIANNKLLTTGILSVVGLTVIGGGVLKFIGIVGDLAKIWGMGEGGVAGAVTLATTAMEAFKKSAVLNILTQDLSTALTTTQALGAAAGLTGAALAGWDIGRFLGQLTIAGKTIDEWVQRGFNVVGKAFGANDAFAEDNLPSHALGLPYVPYDGYKAILHQGEGVLTAQQNKAYLQHTSASHGGKAGGKGGGGQDPNAPFGAYSGFGDWSSGSDNLDFTPPVSDFGGGAATGVASVTNQTAAAGNLKDITKAMASAWQSISQYVDGMPDKINNLLEPLVNVKSDVDEINGLWDTMSGKLDNIIGKIQQAAQAAASMTQGNGFSFAAAGSPASDMFGTAADWGGDLSAYQASMTQFFGLDGSHAGGLDYVPFDGYRAILHRGERVMTAEENRGGKGGLSVGEMHFHAAPGELTAQTDQTRFVREVVIPELARYARG